MEEQLVNDVPKSKNISVAKVGYNEVVESSALSKGELLSIQSPKHRKSIYLRKLITLQGMETAYNSLGSLAFKVANVLRSEKMH